MNSNENTNVLKVAVHKKPYVTRGGLTCHKWHGFYVYAGANPIGPRGGRCGNCVDGNSVSGQLRTREEAHAFAERYARDHHGTIV